MGWDFLRKADWLDAARVRGYLALLAALNIITLVFLIGTSHGGVDRNGFLLGTDFLSFWSAGRMLHAGATVYDTVAHIAAQRSYFVQPDSYTAFFYPPSFLLVCYPLGFLPYFPALAGWLLATGAAYLGVVRLWLQATRLTLPLVLLAAAYPPVWITIAHGQTSFLVAALLGLGALLVPTRPIIAGICFGLVTIKPQFGVLVPLVLLLTGEWRTIGAAAVTAVMLGLGSALLFGPQIWAEWWAISHSAQAAMSEGTVGFAKMQSPFAAALLVGAPLSFAYGLQGLIGLAVAGCIGWASWRQGYTLPLAAAMLAGATLTTPFVLDYDLVVLGFPLIVLAASDRFQPWEKLILATTFIAAAFSRPLAVSIGIPIMPVVLIAFFALLLRRALETQPSRR